VMGRKVKEFQITSRVQMPDVSTEVEADPFIAPGDIPQALKAVAGRARQAGLEITRFQPLPEVKRSTHIEVPVRLVAAGSIQQVAGFLQEQAAAVGHSSWQDPVITWDEDGDASESVHLDARLIVLRGLAEGEAAGAVIADPGHFTGPPFASSPDAEIHLFDRFITAPDRTHSPLTPLQGVQIDALRVVATNCLENTATLQTPDGALHSVVIGDYAGKNWGEIERILCPSVQIKEVYTTIDGDKVVNRIQIEHRVPSAGESADP